MRKKISRVVVLTLTLAVASWAQDESYVKDGKYVTPHFKWAESLVGGPIKTLVIAPETASRDIWDLAQRIPLKHTVFQVNNACGQFGTAAIFGSSLVYEKRRAELNAILDKNQFDLIVLANVCWSSLPMDVVYKISAQVIRGAGVVMTNARFEDPMLEELYTRNPIGDGMELFQPFPFAALEMGAAWKEGVPPAAMLGLTEPYDQRGHPYLDLKGKIMAYQVKKGRFVSMQFPGTSWGAWACVPSLLPGFNVNMKNMWQEEYYYALVAKAFLWAAGRTPPATLQAVAPQCEERPIGEPLTVAVTVAPATGKTSFKGRVAVNVRDSMTGRYLGEAEAEIKVDSGKATCSLPIVQPGSRDKPLLLAADAFIYVQLYKGKDVVDFGAGFAGVETNKTLKVTFNKDTFEFPEPISGTVEIAGNLKPDRMDIDLYDSRGRIWEKASLEVKAASLAFSLPSERTRILSHGVRAVAYKGNKPVGTADGFFTVRRPRESYYFLVSDEAWPTWHSLRRLERAYEWGMDGLRDHHQSVPDAIMTALAGVDLNPGSPHVPITLALDPAEVAKLVETGRTNSGIYRHFNQALYNTTDDSGPEVVVTTSAVPRFIEWLNKQNGGDIAKVNAVWGTDLKDFNALSEDFIKGSKSKGQVEVWVDYCRFINGTYLDAHARYRTAIKEIDPNVAVGGDAMYYGHSLASMYRHLGYIMPYYTPWAVEMGRALAKGNPPVYTGICMGYGRDWPKPYHEYIPWHILFAGNNSILYWSLLAGFDGDLVFADTVDYRPGWMMAEMGRIKLSGAGMFINSCQRDSSGIVILYSEASQRAEDIDAPFNKVENSAVNFQEMLHDHGLSYNYVSSESIVQDGALESGNIKLLILPHAQSLSVPEAEKIKTFVKNGGALLADVRPGVRDDRGKKLEHGQLDDMFGVRRAKDAVTNVSVVFPGAATAVVTKADASVACVSGRAMLTVDNMPLFIENPFGKGRTVLMNVEAAFMGVSPGGDAECATTVRASAPALAAYSFMGDLFVRLGARPRFQARLDDGPPLGVKLIEFTKKDAHLLAVEVKRITGFNYPRKLRLDLGGERYVVEIRSGKVLGQTSVIECPVQPYDVFLFALLPQSPGRLKVSAPQKIKAGENVRATVVRQNAPNASVVLFQLVRPDGVVLRDYQQRVLTDGDRAECNIPLPYNCQTGKWTLETTDLVTQVAEKKTVTVERSGVK